MHAMASQRWLVPLLVLCLLCSACAAAKRRYLSVTTDELRSRSKAHVDCPPWNKSVTTSGNKLRVPAVCGFPDPLPKCCAAGGSFERHRHVLNHDMNRLSTLLQRSSVSQAAPAPAPSADPFPWFPFGPAPSPSPPRGIPIISYPPVAPPAEAPAVTIPDSSGTSLDTLEFVVTVGFGTPVQTYTLSFDTGSDVSWIQCLPCSAEHCYKQHDPLFDPTKSATYSAVPCDHPQCAIAGGKCSNGTCLYKVDYGDGSSTTGVLSHETLSLTSTWSLPGFAFGCSQRYQGDFGDVDGLIGLGRGELSLSSQAAATFGGTFSYCLPSYKNTHGYLTIGSPTPPSNETQYTAMIHKKDYPSFYFVELVSIDIGGYILPVPETVFTRGGTLLDSGTILTYLPPEAYTTLRDRFKFTMKQYNPAPAYDPFDTCYDFTGQNAIFIPAVSFKFNDGGVFDLSFYGIMIFPDDTVPAIGCLAFVARPSTMPFTIVGNTQQRDIEVIYDVAAEKIGFGPGFC